MLLPATIAATVAWVVWGDVVEVVDSTGVRVSARVLGVSIPVRSVRWSAMRALEFEREASIAFVPSAGGAGWLAVGLDPEDQLAIWNCISPIAKEHGVTLNGADVSGHA